MLRSSLCDYSDTYKLVKGTIAVNNTAAADANPNEVNKKLILKNCVSFTNYITRINYTQIDDTKDIDIVMPMYNLIEHSDNYSKIFGILWQYCKDIPAVNNNGDIPDFGESNFTDSFKFKVKIANQAGDNRRKEFKLMVP